MRLASVAALVALAACGPTPRAVVRPRADGAGGGSRLVASLELDAARGSPALAADERSIVVAVGPVERGQGDLFVLDRDGRIVHRAAVEGASPLVVPAREGGVEVLWIGGAVGAGDAGDFAGTRVRSQHLHLMFFAPVAAQASPHGMLLTWRGGCMVSETRLVAYDEAGERGRMSWLGFAMPMSSPTEHGALVFDHRDDAFTVGAYDDRLAPTSERVVPLPEQTYCLSAIPFGDQTALVCSDRTLVFDDAGTLVRTIAAGTPLLDNAITVGGRVWIARSGPVGDSRVCVGPIDGNAVDCVDVEREPFATRPSVAFAEQGSRLLYAFVEGGALQVRAIETSGAAPPSSQTSQPARDARRGSSTAGPR